VELLGRMCHPEVMKRVPLESVDDLHIKHHKLNDLKGRRVTTVDIMIENKWYYGYARCSKEDNFCKDTGRKLALKRALRQFWDYKKANVVLGYIDKVKKTFTKGVVI
jgi:hypothetical protein